MSPTLPGAEHRVKSLSQRAASLREAHLPGSASSHHSRPTCWSWGLIPALPAWLWLVPTPVLGLFYLYWACVARFW